MGALTTENERDNTWFMHYLFLPRKARDSNPRYSYPYTAFRVRPIRPLWQLSKATAKLQTIWENEQKKDKKRTIYFWIWAIKCKNI